MTNTEMRAEIDAFLNEEISKEDFISLVNWLFTSEEVFAYGWSESDQVWQRMFWVYPDKVMITFAPREGVFVTHLTAELSEDCELGQELRAAFPDWGFTWNSAANGFSVDGVNHEGVSVEAIVQLVEGLGALRGEPKVGLPWVEKIEMAEDLADEYEFDEDSDPEDAARIEFMTALSELSEEPKQLPWDASFETFDDGMPVYSSYGRLYELMRVLEEERNWIVINGECCGTCASGTQRDIIADRPELENAPALIIYEQNAEGKWGASGWVCHMIYQTEPEHVKQLEEVCALTGVTLAADSGDENFFYLS